MDRTLIATPDPDEPGDTPGLVYQATNSGSHGAYECSYVWHQTAPACLTGGTAGVYVQTPFMTTTGSWTMR